MAQQLVLQALNDNVLGSITEITIVEVHSLLGYSSLSPNLYMPRCWAQTSNHNELLTFANVCCFHVFLHRSAHDKFQIKFRLILQESTHSTINNLVRDHVTGMVIQHIPFILLLIQYTSHRSPLTMRVSAFTCYENMLSNLIGSLV